MKKLSIAVILMLMFCQLYSQTQSTLKDLVITNNNDSIQCKIVNIKHNRLYYTTDENKETLPQSVQLGDVKKYKYNNYRQTNSESADFQRYSFSINGGYSRRLAKIADNMSSDYEDYIKQLKNGYHFGVDFACYFSEVYGVGAKVLMFKASNSGNLYVENYGRADIKDEVSVPFIGPMFSTRFQNEKNVFLINYALGYLGYTDKWSVGRTNGTNKGGTVGYMFDLDYSYWFSKNTALDISLAFIAGTLSEYTVESGSTKEKVKLDKNEYEGLGRMDISIGLRFGK